MMPSSLLQMPPIARPVFSGDTSPGRIHYLPGRIPSIEQILQKQVRGNAMTCDDAGAEELLTALKRDNLNMEAMLAELLALSGMN